VLATSRVRSYVIFLYDDGGVQWTSGNWSRALAGISTGNFETITIPESLTPRMINITQTSNIGIPGVWIFRVDTGKQIMCIYTNGTKKIGIKVVYTRNNKGDNLQNPMHHQFKASDLNTVH